MSHWSGTYTLFEVEVLYMKLINQNDEKISTYYKLILKTTILEQVEFIWIAVVPDTIAPSVVLSKKNASLLP